jgi:hypothetical protein
MWVRDFCDEKCAANPKGDWTGESRVSKGAEGWERDRESRTPRCLGPGRLQCFLRFFFLLLPPRCFDLDRRCLSFCFALSLK